MTNVEGAEGEVGRWVKREESRIFDAVMVAVRDGRMKMNEEEELGVAEREGC